MLKQTNHPSNHLNISTKLKTRLFMAGPFLTDTILHLQKSPTFRYVRQNFINGTNYKVSPFVSIVNCTPAFQKFIDIEHQIIIIIISYIS